MLHVLFRVGMFFVCPNSDSIQLLINLFPALYERYMHTVVLKGTAFVLLLLNFHFSFSKRSLIVAWLRLTGSYLLLRPKRSRDDALIPALKSSNLT